jgi:hypothetical protein
MQLIWIQVLHFLLGAPLFDVTRDGDFQKNELQLCVAGLGQS